jgi:hypothetical protein
LVCSLQRFEGSLVFDPRVFPLSVCLCPTIEMNRDWRSGLLIENDERVNRLKAWNSTAHLAGFQAEQGESLPLVIAPRQLPPAMEEPYFWPFVLSHCRVSRPRRSGVTVDDHSQEHLLAWVAGQLASLQDSGFDLLLACGEAPRDLNRTNVSPSLSR